MKIAWRSFSGPFAFFSLICDSFSLASFWHSQSAMLCFVGKHVSLNDVILSINDWQGRDEWASHHSWIHSKTSSLNVFDDLYFFIAFLSHIRDKICEGYPPSRFSRPLRFAVNIFCPVVKKPNFYFIGKQGVVTKLDREVVQQSFAVTRKKINTSLIKEVVCHTQSH